MTFLHKNLTVKHRSKISEKSAAEVFNGRVQVASGAFRHAKGDIITDRYLIEDKTTNRASYSLKKTILDKIRLEAFNRGRRPMMRITVEGAVFCVITQDEMLELMHLAGVQ